MQVTLLPSGEETLGARLKAALGNAGYHTFGAAVAFVKRSGVQHIQAELSAFVERGGRVRMVVGVDYQGTSSEGLQDLLTAVGDGGSVLINHDTNWYVSFHPKLYLFEADDSALLIVGSGNLTEGGLYTNDEVSLACVLDLRIAEDLTVLEDARAVLGTWCDEGSATVRRLDESFLESLLELEYVAPEAGRRAEEAEARAADRAPRDTGDRPSEKREPLFGRGAYRRGPPRPRLARPGRPGLEPVPAEAGLPRGFAMTLMQTDVGVGQTTEGTSRRSPEIFIPLTARNRHPEFWGWPSQFAEDPSMPGKFDRRGVQMHIGGEVINVNMMTWPAKHDFRLRSERLRSAGQVGDILLIERADEDLGFTYHVEIVPKESSEHAAYSAACANPTPHSQRRWGYYD